MNKSPHIKDTEAPIDARNSAHKPGWDVIDNTVKTLTGNELIALAIIAVHRESSTCLTSWWKPATTNLNKKGLIVESVDEVDNDIEHGFELSPKGVAFLERIKNTPMPTQMWGYP